MVENKKSKLSKCEECPLFNQHMIIGESNIKNVKDIKLLVLAEAPAYQEYLHNRPLSIKGVIYTAGLRGTDFDAIKGWELKGIFKQRITIPTASEVIAAHES
jgi:hypothetical protein